MDRRVELALLWQARDRIEYALIFVISIVSVVVNYGALTVLYFQYDRKDKNKKRWHFDLSGHSRSRWMNRRNVLGLLAVVTAVSMAAAFDVSRNGSFLNEDLLYESRLRRTGEVPGQLRRIRYRPCRLRLMSWRIMRRLISRRQRTG